MARGNGEGTISKKPRADGNWHAKLTMRDGTRRSFYAKTRAAVRAKMEDAKQRDHAGIVHSGRTTLADYLTHWLEDAVAPPRRAYGTWESYDGHVRVHLIPALGTIRLDALSVSDVRGFLNAMLKRRPHPRSPYYAPRTVNHVRATLRAALADAVRDRLIAYNVAALVPPFPEHDESRAPLTADEARRLMEQMKGDRWHALFAVGLGCGLRVGEATGLTWNRINLDTGELHIVEQIQWQPGGLALVPVKTKGSRRTIVMPHAVRDVLRAHRLRQQVEAERVEGWENARGLAFTTKTGRPIYQATVNIVLRRYLRDAQLPDTSYHLLRHACASLLAAQGVPEIDVQRLLGHASGKTTRRFYQHAYASGQQRVADAIDTVFSEQSGQQSV